MWLHAHIRREGAQRPVATCGVPAGCWLPRGIAAMERRKNRTPVWEEVCGVVVSTILRTALTPSGLFPYQLPGPLYEPRRPLLLPHVHQLQ